MLRQVVSSTSRIALRRSPHWLPADRLLPRPSQLHQLTIPALTRTQWKPTARWFSDAKETPAEASNAAAAAGRAQPEAPAQEPAGEAETAAENPLEELQKALEAREAEAREWKVRCIPYSSLLPPPSCADSLPRQDKCLRTVADFRNLQDRTQREIKSARDFAIQKFAKDLVDSVDNLDRALTTVPAEKLEAEEKDEDLQDLANLYDGLKMTETILMQTLARHGLVRLDPNGQKFDPNEHEATFMAPQPDKENNIVFHVQQKGFKLNGRVLRAAKVGVVKNN